MALDIEPPNAGSPISKVQCLLSNRLIFVTLLLVKLHRTQVFAVQYEVEEVATGRVAAYINREPTSRNFVPVEAQITQLATLYVGYPDQKRLFAVKGMFHPHNVSRRVGVQALYVLP